jgi:hypothetical protein
MSALPPREEPDPKFNLKTHAPGSMSILPPSEEQLLNFGKTLREVVQKYVPAEERDVVFDLNPRVVARSSLLTGQRHRLSDNNFF